MSATRPSCAGGRGHRRRDEQRGPGAARPRPRTAADRQRRRHREPARRERRGRRGQGRPHVVERGVRRAEVEPRDAHHRAVADGGVRARQAGRRMGLPGGRPRRSRRVDRAAAHDPRPRPARHLRHPVRLDRRRLRPDRARRRHEPVPVRALRRSRRGVHPGRGDRGARHLQRRHRPVRHDARDARRPLRARRHGRRRSARCRPAPASLGMRLECRRSASRRSRRTTG